MFLNALLVQPPSQMAHVNSNTLYTVVLRSTNQVKNPFREKEETWRRARDEGGKKNKERKQESFPLHLLRVIPLTIGWAILSH